jgi:hypothetical protein
MKHSPDPALGCGQGQRDCAKGRKHLAEMAQPWNTGSGLCSLSLLYSELWWVFKGKKPGMQERSVRNPSGGCFPSPHVLSTWQVFALSSVLLEVCRTLSLYLQQSPVGPAL